MDVILKKYRLEILNILFIILFIISSFFFLNNGKIEEVQTLSYVFIVALVFLNLNRFSIVKTPFLSGELKNTTKEALVTKKELDLSISKSKSQIKEIEKKVKDAVALAVAGF